MEDIIFDPITPCFPVETSEEKVEPARKKAILVQVPHETWKAARIKAIQEGISLSELIRGWLDAWIGEGSGIVGRPE
jgi:hypothetical protein